MIAVRQSFHRAKRADFAHEFYARFLASDPAVRRKFERTNFDQQRELLVHGVHSMLDFAEGKAIGKMALDRLARRHGPSDLDISADMYERWLHCFVDAVGASDPEFDEALAAAWVTALRPGIDHLVRGGRASTETQLRRRNATISGRS